jgi:hypothetical protein
MRLVHHEPREKEVLMDSTLEFVRSKNRADIELPNGWGATIGLVRMQDCVATGSIPLGVLRQMDELASNGKKKTTEPAPELLRHGMWIRREMVRRTLKRLAPSVAELSGPDIDMPMETIDELPQEVFDFIAGYALRDTPFPTAGAQA